MCEICTDNRFELIEKYRQKLIDATNIETAPDEMKVLDDLLFRFWQMGWLNKLEAVQCKDCKYCEPKYFDFTGDPYWICNNWVAQVDADGFCYEGERRAE